MIVEALPPLKRRVWRFQPLHAQSTSPLAGTVPTMATIALTFSLPGGCYAAQ